MHYWISGTVVATLLLSGCSLWSSDSEVVAKQPPRIAELQIPAGLKQPKRPAQFDLPANVAVGETGDNLELRSPVQVLAVATNSRVEEEEKEARVWFERSEFTGELMPYLQQNVSGFLQQNSIEATHPQPLNWETGWVSEFRETGWWLWKGQELAQQSRFKVLLEPRTHGRTIAVKVELLEQKYVDSDQKLTAIAKRREEVHFLNRLIDHIATIELAAIREAKAKLPDVMLTRAVNEKSEAVMLTTQPLELTWSQLELLFEQLSLEVTDLNRSEYRYYLRFKKPEQGFWDSIWGKNAVAVLPLAEAEYQIELLKSDKGTMIKWLDNNGKALDQKTMDAIYPVCVEAIRNAKIEL